MKQCVFCKIGKEKELVVYEGKFFYLMFDIHPVSPGHMLIIPKRHVVSILDLNVAEQKEFWKMLNKAIKLINSTNLKELYKKWANKPISQKSRRFCLKMLKHPKIGTRPDGYNIGVNEGMAAGRTIHHLHIHVIPRYSGDVKNPVGGIRNIIPKLGNYKN